MSKDKQVSTPSPKPASKPLNEGFQPLQKGHQPSSAKPSGTVQGGYQPTTSQAAPSPKTPPTQGTSGKK